MRKRAIPLALCFSNDSRRNVFGISLGWRSDGNLAAVDGQARAHRPPFSLEFRKRDARPARGLRPGHRVLEPAAVPLEIDVPAIPQGLDLLNLPDFALNLRPTDEPGTPDFRQIIEVFRNLVERVPDDPGDDGRDRDEDGAADGDDAGGSPGFRRAVRHALPLSRSSSSWMSFRPFSMSLSTEAPSSCATSSSSILSISASLTSSFSPSTSPAMTCSCVISRKISICCWSVSACIIAFSKFFCVLAKSTEP